MCGIFGEIGSPRATMALEMSRLLRHRGPDDEGFLFAGETGTRCFFGPDTADATRHAAQFSDRLALSAGSDEHEDATVMLGHRRLSIIDLSPAGHQPMDRSGRYWMVYNGEVYNYPELRDELLELGHSFKSEGDSEVILAAYQEWGEAVLDRFNGMFALAIYDSESRTLFLARDRFGVKPLYLWPTATGLRFASEIKAFTAFDDWRPEPNLIRVHDFLLWNVLDHTEETLFEGVYQLPAGHCITCRVDEAASAKPRQWYNLASRVALQRKGATAQDVKALLEDAVKLRLRADVVVGSCLSGGLDSSAIVCLIGQELGKTISNKGLTTITARSRDAAFDEGRFADLAAARSGARTVHAYPTPQALFQTLDQLVWHQDEPFVSTSIFAQWEVFRAASENGLIVMLDGQGADETFAGYRGFFGAALAGSARRLRLGRWSKDVGGLRRETGFSIVRSLGYTLAYLFPSAIRLLGRVDGRSYGDREWIGPLFKGKQWPDPLSQKGARSPSVSEMSLAQITSTNLPMLLRWEDRNSMAHSIEARVPFLDYRLVELAVALPDQAKVAKGISKVVLREAMRGIVPEEIIDRRDKMGFVTAEALWATRDMASTFREELEEAVARLGSVLSPAIVQQFDEVVAGTRQFDFRFWRAIVLSRWAKVFSISFPKETQR